jgi:dTMP kinase
MINSYLKGTSDQEDHVIHLLFSANRWELASSIRADISAGTTVIIDRYFYSGCVYSAAKDNPTLSLAWSRHPEVGLPRPDGVVFLEISPEEAAKRGGFGEERYENERLLGRVRELFGEMRCLPGEKEDFRVIDANGTKEQVAKEIWEQVMDVFSQVEHSGRELRSVEETGTITR